VTGLGATRAEKMGLPEVRSLLPPTPDGAGVEEVEELMSGVGCRLEWIRSHGEPSPDGFWYDQPRAEWVMLLRGAATLEFEDGVLELTAGDALTIPAGLRHRVGRVSAEAVWLALHAEGAAGS